MVGCMREGVCDEGHVEVKEGRYYLSLHGFV